MDGDEAIAWAEYGTPAELPSIHHRKQYDAEKDADPDWRITCVFVDRRFRRKGLVEVAIRGALDLIAEAGGGVVEGYPHDLTDQTKKMSSSFLYNGTRRLYERLGFTYVRPKGLKNCVMTMNVHPLDRHTPQGYVRGMDQHTAHGAAHGADHGSHHDMGNLGTNAMAISATLHCLTGCAIGEILGLMIGTALGLGNLATIAVAIGLAFVFGYSLSTLPLLRAGLGLGAALTVVLAADTLSIATMEIVDNLVMAVIPGAMEAGLVNPVFWLSMMLALTVAFFAAWPVNRHLLSRGKGHALTHGFHGVEPEGARRYIPDLATSTLVAAIVAFMLGGLVVSVADELEAPPETGHAAGAAR